MFNILTPFEKLNKCIKKVIHEQAHLFPRSELAGDSLYIWRWLFLCIYHTGQPMCESLLRVTGLVPLTWMFPSRWCRSDRWAGWRCPTDRPCVQTLPSFIFKYLGLAALCPLDITQQPWTLGTRHVGAELTVTYTVSNDTIPRKQEVTTQNTFILTPVPRISEGKE